MTSSWEPGLGAEAAARQRRDRLWRIFGIVLVVGIALVGLALVAAAVLVVVAFNSYGSNK